MLGGCYRRLPGKRKLLHHLTGHNPTTRRGRLQLSRVDQGSRRIGVRAIRSARRHARPARAREGCARQAADYEPGRRCSPGGTTHDGRLPAGRRGPRPLNVRAEFRFMRRGRRQSGGARNGRGIVHQGLAPKAAGWVAVGVEASARRCRRINNSNRPIGKSVWSRRQASPPDSVALPLGLRSGSRGLETSDDWTKSGRRASRSMRRSAPSTTVDRNSRPPTLRSGAAIGSGPRSSLTRRPGHSSVRSAHHNAGDEHGAAIGAAPPDRAIQGTDGAAAEIQDRPRIRSGINWKESGCTCSTRTKAAT